MTKINIQFEDISAQTFGKYQMCTSRNGLFYADSDFTGGFGCGGLKPGALPSPHQSTPEKTEIARKMHEDAANKAVAEALKKLRPTRAQLLRAAIRKLETFAGGSLVQIGKGLFIVALAYPIIWLALVVLNS